MLNEAETHKIIDEQLKQIGWEAEWQTDSGFIDYALFVGMKLVATIEAKATHKDVVYRLGEWHDFKVSFTFATNGRLYNRQLKTKSDIWLRRSDNAPKALRGWISPTRIIELLEV